MKTLLVHPAQVAGLNSGRFGQAIVGGGASPLAVPGLTATSRLIGAAVDGPNKSAIVAGGNNTAAVAGLQVGDVLVAVEKLTTGGAVSTPAAVAGAAISGAGTVSLGGVDLTGETIRVSWFRARRALGGAAVDAAGKLTHTEAGGALLASERVTVTWEDVAP